jgi:predicted ferric reductase
VPLRSAFALVLLALAALWLSSMPFGGVPLEVFAHRTVWLQGTGTLAIGVMSVAMLLAARPAVLEPGLGGLDKMYRLHKWLGISALVLAVAHWLWVEAPKWAVDAGWLVRPPRVPAVMPESAWLQALHGLRDAAEGVGEWAFYALVLLLALALWRQFPYRRFFQTHRLLPLVYLALVFHAVVLTRDASWSQPLGVAMAALMAAGSGAALWVLFGAVGRPRQVMGRVERVSRLDALDVLEVGVVLQGRWPGHRPGQFAFLRFDAGEGAHPFTITSAWVGDGRLGFLIKGLGDYTRRLPTILRPGDAVRIEGPYGCFDFEGGRRQQVWVGAGIGITPFVARMQHLAAHPDGRRIDLFHPTAVDDPLALGRLRSDAAAAGVHLHVLVDARDGRLDAARLASIVPGWEQADVWFCGPAGFGQALRRDLRTRGLAARDFHQELFELR